MALSDSEHKQKKTIKRRKTNEVSNKAWSDTQKIECAKTYILTGNLAQTAHVLKIPEPTVRTWATKEWWQTLVKELKASEKLTLTNKLKAIAEKSLGVVLDRLENGEQVYNTKLGKLVPKPVSLKDAHKVASDMILIESKLQTTEQEQTSQETIKEKLEKLAKSFEDFAHKKVDVSAPVIEVTDVVFINETENK